MICSRLLPALVAAATAALVHAQVVPEYEWHYPIVGKPAASEFVPLNLPERKQLVSLHLTLTEDNTLAVIDARNGSLAWRYAYPSTPQYALCKDNRHLATLHTTPAEDTAIRFIDTYTGSVLWEQWLPPTTSSVLACDAFLDEVYVATPDYVSAITPAGVPKWHTPLTQQLSTPQRIMRMADNAYTFLADSADGESLVANVFDITNGRLVATSAVPRGDSFVAVPASPVSDASVYTALKRKNAILRYAFGSDFNLALARSPGIAAEMLTDIGLSRFGIFLATLKDRSVKVLVQGDRGSALPLYSRWHFTDLSGEYKFIPSVDSTGTPYVIHYAYSTNMQLAVLQIVDLRLRPDAGITEESGGLVVGHTFPYRESHAGTIEYLAVQVAPSKVNYNLKARVALYTSSHVLQLWQGEEKLWEIDGGLAQPALAPFFLDPFQHSPGAHSSESGDHSGSPVDAFLARLARHWAALNSITLQDLVALLPGIDRAKYAPRSHGLTDESATLVILASNAGRALYALDLSKQGRIHWKAPLPQHAAIEWRGLFTAVEATHNSHPILGAVVDIDGRETTYLVDARTGEIRVGSADLPPKPAGPAFAGSPHSLRGSFKNRPDEAWHIAIPFHETITNVVRAEFGPVASLGVVLGNRSTLYKYLNPNLRAVVAESDAYVSVYLVDASSGQVLTVFTHDDVVPGTLTHIALRENWLLYTYRQASVGQPGKVVSTQLFYGDGAAGAQVTSPWLDAPLRIFSRSFATAEPWRILGLTTTNLGITSLSAIFTTDLHDILAVPSRVLNPRRVYGKPSKTDLEEGLLAYEPVLATNPQWVISKGRDVVLGRVPRVATSPAHLESQSWVFAFGQDLFSTRVSPSKSFDILDVSFNTLQLTLMLSALFIALIATRTMYNAKQQREKWYPDTTSE